jgi:mannose-6-phosphate isomerase-like protein (cupin superfamily)
MKTVMPWIVAGLVALWPAGSFAQAGAQATTGVSTDLPSADVKAAIARALQELKPGVGASDHLISLVNAGAYNVGVAVVARPAGPSQNSLSHDKITEVYYILRGSGTQVTGTMVNGTRAAQVNPVIGPSFSSTSPLQNTRTRKLGPGDISIIPPGVGHTFTTVDAGGIEYLVFRVDPDRVLSQGK